MVNRFSPVRVSAVKKNKCGATYNWKKQGKNSFYQLVGL